MVLDFIESCEIEICENIEENKANEENTIVEISKSNDENDNEIANQQTTHNSKRALRKGIQIQLQCKRLKPDALRRNKAQIKCLYCDYIASNRKEYSRHRLESHPKSQLRFNITNNNHKINIYINVIFNSPTY